MKRAAHPGSARADRLKSWTDNLFNDRLNCVERRTQGTLDVVPLGQELRCVVTHGETLKSVKPRSAITRVSRSTVCATDLLLCLVMIQAKDCELSSIRTPILLAFVRAHDSCTGLATS
jgi:hypothetical protein